MSPWPKSPLIYHHLFPHHFFRLSFFIKLSSLTMLLFIHPFCLHCTLSLLLPPLCFSESEMHLFFLAAACVPMFSFCLVPVFGCLLWSWIRKMFYWNMTKGFFFPPQNSFKQQQQLSGAHLSRLNSCLHAVIFCSNSMIQWGFHSLLFLCMICSYCIIFNDVQYLYFLHYS